MTPTVQSTPRRTDSVVADVDVRDEIAEPAKEIAGSEYIAGGSVWVKFLQPAHDTVVLTVAGEIDMSSTPRLWEALCPWLAPPTQTVVMDLSAVTFIDSGGAELLCQCQRRAETWSVSLRLATNHTSRVDRVLDLLNLGDRFLRYPSLAEALTG